MGQTLNLFGASWVTSLLLARFAPQYSLGIVSTAFLLFFAELVAYLGYQLVLYPRFFSPIRHIPGPTDGHWLLGQTGQIVKEPAGYPMMDWIRSVPNSGLIRYSVWCRDRLLVTTPSALSEVLVTKNYDFVKPQQVRNGLGRILGVGILLAEGEEHRVQRKNLMPAFAFRHVKNIYPIFWKKSQEMVDCLAAASRQATVAGQNHVSDTGAAAAGAPQHEAGAVDVGNWTSRATLDIIGLSGMGQDFDSLHNPQNKLNETYRSVFSLGRNDRVLQIIGALLPFWLLSRLPLKRNHELAAAAGYIKQVCRDMIAEKRKALASEKGRTEVDILSVAMESGGFQDEELVNQMMTFLVAGHETTATAMIWAIYQLCRQPELQHKLRAEIRAHVPALDAAITPDQIDGCHYLQATCNEVLRLWSPVTLTLRVADKNTSIAGEFVPKGTLVVMALRATNTSTERWGADAGDFKPERWLNSDGKVNAHGGADSNYDMLTFLHGPRSCIGQKFAQAEFACLLAAWVGRFETEFEADSPLARGEMELNGGVTVKPKGGVWVKLKEVPGW